MHFLAVTTALTLILSSMALISFFVLRTEQQHYDNTYPVEYGIQMDEPEEPEELPKASRNYSLGSIQPNQVLVGFGSNSYEFRNYTNVQITVEWPTENPREDFTFTWLSVYTNQSSTFGTAFVLISGGYNAPEIKFAVQANNTLLFEYKYEIYARQRSSLS